jgi:hypothetical protein
VAVLTPMVSVLRNSKQDGGRQTLKIYMLTLTASGARACACTIPRRGIVNHKLNPAFERSIRDFPPKGLAEGLKWFRAYAKGAVPVIFPRQEVESCTPRFDA